MPTIYAIHTDSSRQRMRDIVTCRIAMIQTEAMMDVVIDHAQRLDSLRGEYRHFRLTQGYTSLQGL